MTVRSTCKVEMDLKKYKKIISQIVKKKIGQGSGTSKGPLKSQPKKRPNRSK